MKLYRNADGAKHHEILWKDGDSLTKACKKDSLGQLFSRQRNKLDLMTRWKDGCCVSMSRGGKGCAILAKLLKDSSCYDEPACVSLLLR